MKKVVYKILLILNVVSAAALLMSYLAAIVSPAQFALPAYFGLGYPYLLLLNILIVIVWAMLLRFEALISVAAIAIGITHFSNSIKFTKTKNDTEGTFKIVSYNARLFSYFKNNKAVNVETEIFSFLNKQKADIVCIQEFFISGDIAEKEKAMAAALGGKYFAYLKTIRRTGTRAYGTAVFTKFPIVGKGEISYPESTSFTTYTDILIDKDTVRLYNNHLQSFRLKSSEKSFLENIITENNDMTGVKNLWSSLKTGFVKRSLQSQILKEHINASKYPVIVAGDFNDTPVSYTYHKIRKGLNDAFVNSGYGAGFTYQGNYPSNRIDYILYDKSIVNSGFEVLRIGYSDHYPIAAWFKRKVN